MPELPPNPITSPFHNHALPHPQPANLRPCPTCGAPEISCLALLRSALGIGPHPRCRHCHGAWSVGSRWQGNYAGALLLAFVFAGALSVKHRSYLPYLLLPLVLGGASLLVCRFARARPVLPMAAWLKWLHYLVLVLFLALFLMLLLRF